MEVNTPVHGISICRPEDVHIYSELVWTTACYAAFLICAQ